MADKKITKPVNGNNEQPELGGILSHDQLEKLAAAVSNAQTSGADGTTPAGYYFVDE